MLRVEHLDVSYGPIAAIEDVSLDVAAGESVCLLGSNGAGKSTFIRAIAGLLPIGNGEVWIDGTMLNDKPVDYRARIGMAVVFEGRGMLAGMTVRENLLMGGYLRPKPELLIDLERVLDRFPQLRERQKQLAGTLSGGEQQMVAIGRALMARPRIILMDEPSMGLAPVIVEQVFEIVNEIAAQGIALLLVEQNVHMAIETCQRFYVLGKGRVVLHGQIAEGSLVSALDGQVLGEDRLEAAYLGG